MRDTYVSWRLAKLQELGGLPSPEVKNKEWLYLLKNETRNSIMVEGIFVKEQELDAVISGGNHEIRGAADVLNYFRTARFLYGLGFENYSGNELILSRGLIRQINKGLLEERSREAGALRKGKVMIGGAKIEPPEFDLEEWIDLYIKWVIEHFGKLPMLEFIALQHAFFEAIHPFVDGNGRTGRILTNYLFVNAGFPIITIKGDNSSREQYYSALQDTDCSITSLFEESPGYDRVCAVLAKTKYEKLENLVFKGLRESADRIIISLLEEKGQKMLPTEELAAVLGYSKSTIRKLVERGKLISLVRGKSHYSHPSLLFQYDSD